MFVSVYLVHLLIYHYKNLTFVVAQGKQIFLYQLLLVHLLVAGWQRPVPVLLPRSGVVNTFTEIVEPLYENVVLNMKQSASLTALRDALLPRLISGELRVPDAEKMLEEVGI